MLDYTRAEQELVGLDFSLARTLPGGRKVYLAETHGLDIAKAQCVINY
jgi:hypothetical protein